MTLFYKLSGAGNDFIALVEPDFPPEPGTVRAWCRRGLSIGADGVVCLAPTVNGARMTHFNADGERSDLCLNGSRSAAQLAFHLGWHEKSLSLETDVGTLAARRISLDRIALELPEIAGVPEPLTLDVEGTAYPGYHLGVGVPHFILPWPEDLSEALVAKLGPPLRSHPGLGRPGANVSFVHFESPGSSVGLSRLAIRTFERGVEAETLACGTGTIAAALAGVVAGKLRLPVRASTSGGFELVVSQDSESGRLLLEGDARVVFRGEILGDSAERYLPAERCQRDFLG